MSNNHYDAVIIGCGLAGAAISWQLHWRRKRILVIDDPSYVSASKAAAGVISPITGKRHTSAWRWQEFWAEARAFYEEVSTATGSNLLRTMPQFRFPVHPISGQVMERAAQFHGLNKRFATGIPKVLKPEVSRHGVLEIESGVLDVNAFLAASSQMIQAHHRIEKRKVRYADLQFDNSKVSISNLSVTADNIVFCEGARGAENPWFKDLNFESVRGESLIVDIEHLPGDRIFHHGISLVPISNNNFYAGATYDWQNTNLGTTSAGKKELEVLIRSLITTSFDTLTQQSGIRPVIRGRRPTIQQHPRFQRCWFFNGLASSGCLQAPLLAAQLAKAIITGNVQKLRSDALPNKLPVNPDGNLRLTTRAHQLASELIQPGDVAIDATAGNGNDTKFLAEQVGADGQVFAFDIQALALERSAKRLEGMPYRNVEFKLEDHCKLNSAIPKSHHGNITLVMFNLGYLPGADEAIITLPSSTLPAIQSALALIKTGGACTVLCYRGHHGGQAEAIKVENLLSSLDKRKYTVDMFRSNQDEQSPILYFATKLVS